MPFSSPSSSSSLGWLVTEFGLSSVHAAGRDAWLIIAARSLRMFAYGATSLIIALFFSSLHFSDSRIGLFFSLTSAGDVALSFLSAMVADSLGRRRVLLLGGILMMFSGSVFALFDDFWILLFAAVVGVLSSTGGDYGPFRSVEESILSQLTTPKSRADVMSWYITCASSGSAMGTMLSGHLVHALQKREFWRITDVYHCIFLFYIAAGALNVLCASLLSEAVELEATVVTTTRSDVGEAEAAEGLLRNGEAERQIKSSEALQEEKEAAAPKRGYFARISAGTRSVMYKLWFLLIVDSLADGMVPISLTTYFIDQKFQLAKSTLGDITSASYVLSAISTVFAAPLARRLGLINTMVFTHLPSSLAVLLFPVADSVPLMVLFFFLRTGLNNMDQAPRSAFIAAVVRPEERTAVMGITSVLRTLAATCGPSVTGLLASSGKFWIAFVAAGVLRICYDLGLWAMFVNTNISSDVPGDKAEQGARQSSLRDEEELQDIGQYGPPRHSPGAK